MADSFGMMEGAYFVSKNELLNWANDLLKVNLTKVEQFGTGAVLCGVLDACYPGEVALHKVNWKARLEWEFVNNFKVLQQAFQKMKINRHIDVEKLVKAKYQDNLEFAQWMKRYYEIKFGREIRKDYDPVARRNGVEPDFSFVEHKIPTKANLDYQNFRYSMDAKRQKTKDLPQCNNTSKKVKLNNGGTIIQNKENYKDTMDPNIAAKLQDYEKVKRERDTLMQKLNDIESIVMNSQDQNDSHIVKNVRDYLGSLVRPLQQENGHHYQEQHGQEGDQYGEDLLNGDPEDSKEVLMLIEGESI